jgi:superfamily II DNA or RNA helicase/phage repressor protein C with HTH and peptisase S24 domain
MPAKTKKSNSYFENHQLILNSAIQKYKEGREDTNLFSTSEYSIFNTLEKGITKYPLRHYQLEALYILDFLLKTNNKQPHKKDLLEMIDKDTEFTTPFMGFEMATGSGKTMLMGAAIYLLNKKYNIRNFLIITPASTDIYQKTIRNFTPATYETIWADDTPFSFNLITGDNYTQNLFFDDTKDANIFVFNISKFGSNATNSDKTWESATWKDDNGNNISIREYLKNKKLVIITDEAHHAQTRTANAIIKKFEPDAVLEYTATAIEGSKTADKKNQTVVYKYDIKRFLEDGHGKLVRAIALASESKTGKNALPESEKLKLITMLLIHILKRFAVLEDAKSRNQKPLSFVKVKNDTKYAQLVFDYLTLEIQNEEKNLNIVLEKIQTQNLEITNLLVDMFLSRYKKKTGVLLKDMERAAKNSIFYHGKSDKETEKAFENIRKNSIEIIVYMNKLDEGIDMPNIYTIAVINDTLSELKTSVRQIIGRGVRLNKEKRQFSLDDHSLVSQTEKLHIVCDQGKNFEEVILSIQKEFGLNDKYLSFEKTREKVTNHAKSKLLNGRFLPKIKADFKAKPDVKLMDLLSDTETVVNKFIEHNCFNGKEDNSKKFLKYKPDAFIIEVDVFADRKVYHEQMQKSGGIETIYQWNDKTLKDIYNIVHKSLYCLPETETVKNIFEGYKNGINQKQLYYYRLDDSDDVLIQNLFTSVFSFFYKNHIEKNYFQLDFSNTQDIGTWSLSQHFKDEDINIPKDQTNSKKGIKEKDTDKVIQLIQQGYLFYGYEKSIYDYVSFDSLTEKQLSDYADYILKELNHNKVFWLRNNRQVYFEYGTKKYYPDFIWFDSIKTLVLETKGEAFSDWRKNALLKKLNEIEGYKALLVYEEQLKNMGKNYISLEEFIKQTESFLDSKVSSEQVMSDPPENLKYIQYLPIYEMQKAYKKFKLKQKTPKEEGWLLVDKQEYPTTAFVVQIKGDSLEPKYKHNDWMIVNLSETSEDILDKLSIVRIRKTEEYAIGIVRLVQTKKGMFAQNSFVIEPLNANSAKIEIEDVNDFSQLEVLALEYKPEENVSVYKKALQYITDFKKRMFKDALPVYSLQGACGKFGNHQTIEELGWVDVRRKGLHKDMFIVQAVGNSMSPKINDGDFCIFKANPVGSRQNKILLVEHRTIDSSETGGHYTIKKYKSEKTGSLEDGGRHCKIILEPINIEYKPIVFENVDEDFENEFKVIAEFVEVVDNG